MKTSFNQSRFVWRVKSAQMMSQVSLETRVKPARGYNRRKENANWRKESE